MQPLRTTISTEALDKIIALKIEAAKYGKDPLSTDLIAATEEFLNENRNRSVPQQFIHRYKGYTFLIQFEGEIKEFERIRLSVENIHETQREHEFLFS